MNVEYWFDPERFWKNIVVFTPANIISRPGFDPSWSMESVISENLKQYSTKMYIHVSGFQTERRLHIDEPQAYGFFAENDFLEFFCDTRGFINGRRIATTSNPDRCYF